MKAYKMIPIKSLMNRLVTMLTAAFSAFFRQRKFVREREKVETREAQSNKILTLLISSVPSPVQMKTFPC